MTIESKAKKIFRLSESKNNPIYPPEQVFVNTNLEFLVTFGFGIANDEKEYQKLINLLKELSETEFYLLENLGATITDRSAPHQEIISVQSSFEDFQRIVESIDYPFGFTINSFYFFGQNTNWGIYICEHPTINIIGCTPDLLEKFADVFEIVGNGFIENVDFIAREYQYKLNILETFVENYKLQKRMP